MIELKWAELRYDIELQTYHMSQMRMSDRLVSADKRNYDEVVTEQTLGDCMLRFCEEGAAKLYAVMREVLSGGSVSDGSDADDALSFDKKSWRYDFKAGKMEVQERAMAMLMHKFVVAYALSKWAKQFASDASGAFEKEAEDALGAIEGEALVLSTPVKKRRERLDESGIVEVMC